MPDAPDADGSSLPSGETPTEHLLRQMRAGQRRGPSDRLVGRVYDELRRLARVVRGPGTPATLNTTALVHEAYLRLTPLDGLDVEDRLHFFRLAARAMRQVLAREGRRRQALKRGGAYTRVTFDEQRLSDDRPVVQLLTINDALDGLERLHARQAQVVECRVYAGLSVDETARVLGVSTATVKRDWRAARAWLSHHLRARE